jgi:Na+/H+-dicarboxylate symporter
MNTFIGKSFKNLAEQYVHLISGRLWLKVLIALMLGVILGILLGPDLGLVSAELVKPITAWLALPGQVFLAIIQMIVVPLVIASIVRGLAANNNPAAIKKNGLIALMFIVLSTAIAAAVGIGLALGIQPGEFVDASEARFQLMAMLYKVFQLCLNCLTKCQHSSPKIHWLPWHPGKCCR